MGKQNNDSTLDNLTQNSTPLEKSIEIQEKVRSLGFNWKNVEGILLKIKEEIQELECEIKNNKRENVIKETGDLFFSIINLARYLNIDPEKSLKFANQKFISRFKKLEIQLEKKNKKIEETDLEEMEKIWNNIKNIER